MSVDAYWPFSQHLQEFHKFYFDNGNTLGKHASTISQPRCDHDRFLIWLSIHPPSLAPVPD